MKRVWIGLLAVAVALAIAQPAGAKKPDCEADPPHPACKESPETGGYTCAEYAAMNPDWGGTVYPVEANDSYGERTWDFVLELSGREEACIDVIAPAGRWLVSVTANHRHGLMMVPRDSFSPGDSCGGAGFGNDPNGDWTLPLLIDTRTEIPSSHVNACGTEFGEWIRGEDDELELVMDETVEENPLAFVVEAGGPRKRATTTIKVDLPVPAP
jgi:hypothetical protein